MTEDTILTGGFCFRGETIKCSSKQNTEDPEDKQRAFVSGLLSAVQFLGSPPAYIVAIGITNIILVR